MAARPRSCEAAFQGGAPLPAPLPFEKAHYVPAVLRSVGVSHLSPLAGIELEDADGRRFGFRITPADALVIMRFFNNAQPRLAQSCRPFGFAP